MNIIVEILLSYIVLILWAGYFSIALFFKEMKYKYISLLILIFYLLWIIYRIFYTGFAPFSNLYESLIFFGLLCTIKIKLNEKDRSLSGILSIAGIALTLITLFIPIKNRVITTTLPSLISYWIYIHVPLIFIGYLSLLVSFIIAVMMRIGKNQYKSLLGKELKLSLFFITAGIMSGGFWADKSWGVFWGWDPKEIWALIVWIFLVAAVHIKKSNLKFYFILLSFLAMAFTYFGVTYLLSGLHSYG